MGCFAGHPQRVENTSIFVRRVRADMAYVSVKVGIEMHALERAAEDTARATEALARAVRDMADLPSLTPAQQASSPRCSSVSTGCRRG